MTKDIVHEMYIEALKDERAILKRAIAEGDNIAELARDMLDSCNRTLAQVWFDDMAHYMRGSRDFWANQVKIHGAA